MTPLSTWAAAVTALLIATTGPAPAVSFDERWSSLFGVSQITNETVGAKAEMLPPEVRRPRETRSRRARRETSSRRSRGSRSGLVREWYKGGKKWHYVRRR